MSRTADDYLDMAYENALAASSDARRLREMSKGAAGAELAAILSASATANAAVVRSFTDLAVAAKRVSGGDAVDEGDDG